MSKSRCSLCPVPAWPHCPPARLGRRDGPSLKDWHPQAALRQLCERSEFLTPSEPVSSAAKGLRSRRQHTVGPLLDYRFELSPWIIKL